LGTPVIQAPDNAVASLAASGAIADGTELRLVPAGSYAGQVALWVAEQPERGRAIWRAGERVKALEWPVDSGRYSASGLAEHIVRLAAGRDTSIVGPEWWALEDGTTLAELAGTSMPSRRDWTPLHQLLPELKPGEWTTYGDLAEAIGSHAIAVGQHLTRCEDCESAYRVLGSDRRPRANFTWSDPTETRWPRGTEPDRPLQRARAAANDLTDLVARGDGIARCGGNFVHSTSRVSAPPCRRAGPDGPGVAGTGLIHRRGLVSADPMFGAVPAQDAVADELDRVLPMLRSVLFDLHCSHH